MRKHFGNWESDEDVLCDFGISDWELTGLKILFAHYDVHGYDGRAFVLLRGATGRLYEVSGSHCSCYGLEGCWEPEATTAAAIKSRLDSGYFGKNWEDLDREALYALVSKAGEA